MARRSNGDRRRTCCSPSVFSFVMARCSSMPDFCATPGAGTSAVAVCRELRGAGSFRRWSDLKIWRALRNTKRGLQQFRVLSPHADKESRSISRAPLRTVPQRIFLPVQPPPPERSSRIPSIPSAFDRQLPSCPRAFPRPHCLVVCGRNPEGTVIGASVAYFVVLKRTPDPAILNRGALLQFLDALFEGQAFVASEGNTGVKICP